jgi:hypothetical protein
MELNCPVLQHRQLEALLFNHRVALLRASIEKIAPFGILALREPSLILVKILIGRLLCGCELRVLHHIDFPSNHARRLILLRGRQCLLAY